MSEIKPLHAYSDGKFNCILSTDGKFHVNGVEKPWYKNEVTGEPFLPVKFKSFKSLCKMAIKDGDFD